MEITPEPTPEEREVIVRALAQLNGHGEPSGWWLAGVRDSVGDEEEDYASARPRSRPGAIRA